MSYPEVIKTVFVKERSLFGGAVCKLWGAQVLKFQVGIRKGGGFLSEVVC